MTESFVDDEAAQLASNEKLVGTIKSPSSRTTTLPQIGERIALRDPSAFRFLLECGSGATAFKAAA